MHLQAILVWTLLGSATSRLTSEVFRRGKSEEAVSAFSEEAKPMEVLKARRLDDSLPRCRAQHQGLPIRAVQYVPHLVGEPFPFPESNPQGYYSAVFQTLHQRDLPLIGNVLQADTLRIRPWPLESSNRIEAHSHFLNLMRTQGICKLVPTFQLAKHYAEMLKQGKRSPETNSDSHLATDFVRFGGTVEGTLQDGIEIVGWSLDLSLDLFHLLPLVQSDCKLEPKDESYSMYKSMLEVMVAWVRQQGIAGSAAPALRKVPLLVPLDLSQIDWTQHAVETKLATLLECLDQWSAPVFGQFDDIPRTRWLLSFSLPYELEFSDCRRPNLRCFPFETLLHQLAARLAQSNTSAVIMVGTQALRPDPSNNPNPVQDYGNETDAPRQQVVLQKAYESYQRVNESLKNLDGFILDEWQDDWDRGQRGPFFLAKETLQAMKKSCEWGGRFSHDIGRCSRTVGWGHIYPEFFGQVSTASALLRHCAGPRFRKTFFTFNVSAQVVSEGPLPVDCRLLEPHYAIVMAALGLLALVSVLQVGRTAFRSCRSGRRSPRFEHSQSEMSLGGMKLKGHVTIMPKEVKLRGGHQFELHSSRIRSEEEVGWWLWCHLSAQLTILEKQIQAEISALKALRMRQKYTPRSNTTEMAEDSEEEDPGHITGKGDDVATAMAIVHKRVLEGVAAWCVYVAEGLCLPSGMEKHQLKALASSIEENSTRPLAKLFAEALLLRTMESLSEQILHCPERLAFLYFKVLVTSKEELGDDDFQPMNAVIDLETLQDGLDQIQFHSNPFEWKRMPNGRGSLGINFDDINECGIQCRDEVVKTFKEPRSLMVVLDFLICYRVPSMLKVWTLLISVYIYLGTGFGNDITTSFNGSWYKPKWLRLNFIQYTAAADAAAWVVLETMTILYTCWQRYPSLCRRSPGVPGLKWISAHFINGLLSAAGFVMVWSNAKFATKPWQCRQSDTNECVDERAATFLDLWGTLMWAIIYWLARVILFWLSHRRSFPMFIHGTPWNNVRTEGGRGSCDKWKANCRVRIIWILMLMCSIAIEVVIILPSMKGLDLNTACGLDVLGDVIGLPFQVGDCSEKESLLDFGCVTCVGSVLLAMMLVFLGSLVDVYFVFYIFSAIFGSMMGHRRHLNDVKNISVPIDLRPGVGKDAFRFEAAFGPQWQLVWREIVQSLLDESYISPRMAKWLVEAAGISLDGTELLQRRDKKDQPIHLTRFPSMAAERLAFFFQSLSWIQDPGNGITFRAETDALTATMFDPGTVPSLTQIIPAFNEVVIPSVEFLRSGALPEDAMNRSPDDQHGIGDLTAPPLGDGVNPNLAFIISQFPEEWMFLAKRLFHESLIEQPNSHELYKSFMKRKLREELVIEVRLWAAMRTQTVAKTVVGALQCARALASLPKMKQYYAQFPEKRNPEDHAELILAHQTFGQKAPEGDPENDEAIKLLLSRHANDPVLLVFDLTPSTSEELWYMVEAFLTRRGGYQLGAFTYASVKCRWDSSIRDLSVLEVLPRKYPLRLGQGEYKTQGKACNQLNAVRFASGHYIQALDCNMGTFRGEGFKVPYVLRLFMPLDKKNRVATQCRYLGFREHIYTGREGTVGKCHAAAEWTFGTIYQRFLSGMGTRMHYGHPDFVDGFWARNRGGMSKGSPVVNLSEDIFAGYNVHMREEASRMWTHSNSRKAERQPSMQRQASSRRSPAEASESFVQEITICFVKGSVYCTRSRFTSLRWPST